MTKDKPSWLSKWDWNLKLREWGILPPINYCLIVFGKTMGYSTPYSCVVYKEFRWCFKATTEVWRKQARTWGCLFSVVVPGYCFLIFPFHCVYPEPGSRNQNVGRTGWTRWTVGQGGRKLGSDQCWHERGRKEFDRPWKVLWFVRLSLEKVINFSLKVDLILDPKLAKPSIK